MNAMKVWKAIGNGAKRVGHAVSGGVYAGLTYLVGVWGEQVTVHDAFAGMTAQQWGLCALAIMGGMGLGQAAKRRAAAA